MSGRKQNSNKSREKTKEEIYKEKGFTKEQIEFLKNELSEAPKQKNEKPDQDVEKSEYKVKTEKTGYKAKKKKKYFIIGGVIAVIALFLVLFLYQNSVEYGHQAEIASRNDLRRRLDFGNLYTALMNYRSNNSGKMPSPDNSTLSSSQYWDKFLSDYKVSELKDAVDGSSYEIVESCEYGSEKCTDPSSLTWAKNKHEIYLVSKAQCTDPYSGVPYEKSDHNGFAIYSVAEGDTGYICLSS